MLVNKLIIESIKTKLKLLDSPDNIRTIERIAQIAIKILRNGNKILIAGNGGSAADSQHFAAELSGKFVSPKRKGLPAIALTTNSSNITAIGNDFGYDQVFIRQLEALGSSGDIFFGISTSGDSKNLIEALRYAREKNITTIGLLGNGGGNMKEACDISLIVPSRSTQNIQEAHIMIIHIICQIIDDEFKED